MAVFYFISITFVVLSWVVKGNVYGPTGVDHDHHTSCDEFSEFARFNPFSVLGVRWMIFYYWSSHKQHGVLTFYLPTSKQRDFVDSVFEGHLSEPINWTANHLFMMDQRNVTSLLVERSDRGHYWLYELYRGMKDGDIIKPLDVRLKQKSGYVGMMICESGFVIVLCDILKIPPQKMLQEAASTLGYHGTKGRSYLYAGHDWVPIPEIDEKRYFRTFPHIMD